MRVEVKRGDVTYYCTSEEQLELFLGAGYEKIGEEKTKAEPKKTRASKK